MNTEAVDEKTGRCQQDPAEDRPGRFVFGDFDMRDESPLSKEIEEHVRYCITFSKIPQSLFARFFGK